MPDIILRHLLPFRRHNIEREKISDLVSICFYESESKVGIGRTIVETASMLHVSSHFMLII